MCGIIEVVFVLRMLSVCVYREDSASKASGCCVLVIFYVWTLKKCERGCYVLPFNRTQGQGFSAAKVLAVSTNKDSITRITKLSCQVVVDCARVVLNEVATVM